jgi:ubiquinone/menaquinone biosynthesis C-methylase UbiE
MAQPDSVKRRSSAHFDRWARRYERDPVSRFIAGAQAQALEALELTGDDRFLDVGCGTGAAVRQAASRVERAVGVDLSEAMVGRARELAAGIQGVEFVVGDSERLPFAGGEFTALLCTTSFHHYPRPERAVAEMARVLGPGGRVAIADGAADRLATRVLDGLLRRFQPSHVGFHPAAELERFLAGAGFEGIASRSLWGGGYAIVTGRRA